MPDETVRAIEFSPNSDLSFVLAFTAQEVIIYASDQTAPVQKLTVPYLEAELYELSYDYQVDSIFVTHYNHAPRIIKFLGQTDPPFSIGNLHDEDTWKTPPFLKEDTTNTELVVSDEIHYVKVISDNTSEFNSVPADLVANPTYIEIQVENRWGLYRLVNQAYDASVPGDPSGRVSWAIPMTSIVTGVPSSAQFYLVDNSYPELSDAGLASDERELRCDTLVFNHDLIGAYIRAPLSYRNTWSTGIDSSETVWVKLTEYLGQDDFATELFEGALATDDLQVGSVYKIVNDGTSTLLNVQNAAPTSGSGISTPDWAEAFEYTADGDTFSVTNYYRVETGGDSGTKVANLSTNTTFDIMKSDPPVTIYATTGNIVFDDDQGFHTATLKSSGTTFTLTDEPDAGNDQIGRSIMVKYGDTWTTYRVRTYTDPQNVTVDVLNTIPRQGKDGNYVNNGRSSIFRLSAWWQDNYPYTVAFHEQRLVFGGTPHSPETLGFSKITDLYDFRTIEADGQVLDTTGITYSLGGRSFNRIRWMASGPTLLVGTESSEWQLRPNTFGEALTPTNVRITRETVEGSNLFGIRVGSSVIFVERSGHFVRELFYSFQEDQYRVRDLTLLADHLFENDAIVDFAYQKTPHPTLWFITESGKAYSLLYDPGQELYAWSRHVTRDGDKFKSVAVMERNATITEDRVFFMILRGTEIQVEYLAEQFYDDGSDNFKPNMVFLDSSVREPETGYLGADATQITGLYYDDDTEVSVVVDGAYVGEATVTSGVVDITDIDPNLVAEKYILVGFKYTSEMHTLPMTDATGQSSIYGDRGRVLRVGAYVIDWMGMQVGHPDNLNLSWEYRDFNTVMDQSPSLYTGFLRPEVLDMDFTLDKSVGIKQDKPYPLTIVSLLPEL